MKENLKKKWIELLRSGKYKQGVCNLKNTKTNEYCCLGVLCEAKAKISKKKVWGKLVVNSSANQPFCKKALKIFGLTEHDISTLTLLNDVEKKTFNEIADYIQEKIQEI